MRVESPVQRYVQMPGTIFGVPPLYGMVIAVAMLVLVAVCRVIGSNALAFGAVVFLAPPAVTYAIYLRRQEPHCDTLLIQPTSFFRGAKERSLIAGGAKPRKKKS